MTKEECHPTVPAMRTDESVPGAEKNVALGTGLARERRLLITGEPPKQAEDRKKPNPSACTGLAEHLLPRRHGLIQSFLRSNRWLVERFHRRVIQVRFPESWSSTFSGKASGAHAPQRRSSSLTTPSLLSRATRLTPADGSLQINIAQGVQRLKRIYLQPPLSM